MWIAVQSKGESPLLCQFMGRWIRREVWGEQNPILRVRKDEPDRRNGLEVRGEEGGGHGKGRVARGGFGLWEKQRCNRVETHVLVFP